MDEQEIARLRELASKATPRPWKSTPAQYEPYTPGILEDDPGMVSGAFITPFKLDCGDYLGLSDADADYIVAAVNTHEALLDENAQQRAEIARLREALENIAEIRISYDASKDKDKLIRLIDEIRVTAKFALRGGIK